MIICPGTQFFVGAWKLLGGMILHICAFLHRKCHNEVKMLSYLLGLVSQCWENGYCIFYLYWLWFKVSLNKWMNNEHFFFCWRLDSITDFMVWSWASIIIKRDIKNNWFKIFLVFLGLWRGIHHPAKSHTYKVAIFNMEKRKALGAQG